MEQRGIDSKGAVRLTVRDRELIDCLALAGFMSTEQIARLLFRGTADRRVRRRLGRLVSDDYLRRVPVHDLAGQPDLLWTLAEYGTQVSRVPEKFVAPERVLRSRDLIALRGLSELFVEIALHSAPLRGSFIPQLRCRWRPLGVVHLGRGVPSRVVVEVPQARRILYLDVMEQAERPAIVAGRVARIIATFGKQPSARRLWLLTPSFAQPWFQRQLQSTLGSAYDWFVRVLTLEQATALLKEYLGPPAQPATTITLDRELVTRLVTHSLQALEGLKAGRDQLRQMAMRFGVELELPAFPKGWDTLDDDLRRHGL
jgi:hypothetical protein